MGREKLLYIEPQELNFRFELGKQASCTIWLSNNSRERVAFKVKTTNPEKYAAQPNIGILLPRSSCDLKVSMLAPKEASPNMQCEDKFLIKSVVAGPGDTVENSRRLFNERGHVTAACKLRVVYIFPRHQQPSDFERSVEEERRMHDTERRKMSTGELLNVEPVELKFPFELKKQLSCSLQVSNKTENYVAFKVKTTNPKKYCVRPNTGVVLPRSTSDIVVTMQAHEEAPPEMQCSDKFCLQSVIATPGATPKDITSEMFNEEQVKVEECILKVVYIAPRQPPSPVVEGSPEGVSPRYSAAENGNEDRNGTHAGELFMKGIGIVFLCSIFLYLLMKMLLPLIWSLTFMIIMFVIRMVRRLVSDSIEDWIEKTLFYFCIHFFTVLFQLFRRGESRANNESRVSNAR